MKTKALTIPQLMAVAGTRALLGAGVALLLANRIDRRRRRALGRTLATIGLVTTFPIARMVFSRDRVERAGRSARTVRDVMTKYPVCCEADATLQEVARRMLDEDTGFIPLLRHGRVCGVITDRDLAVRATAKGVDPLKAPAHEFCSKDIAWVPPGMTIAAAVKCMEERQIRRLLVCDKGIPVGVVSLGDLAEVDPDEAEEVLTEVSKSAATLAHRLG